MLETNREAVFTIQGGGVYALSLLGQAKAVLDRGYLPLAYAGTSGGAILACLLWCGLSPEQIETEFIQMLEQDRSALLNLLSPFEPDPAFDFDAYVDLRNRIGQALLQLPAAGTQNPGILRRVVDGVRSIPSGLRTANRLRQLWKEVEPHVRHRGLFTGGSLEHVLDRLIRRGFGEYATQLPAQEPVRFGNVEQLIRDSNGDFYRPPLILTATNLSRRRLDVISSIDPAYMGIPVATAVRASAGFPIFFRPRDILECRGGECFVDGGVVSNFPVWTFSDAFREQISDSKLYRPLARRPWLRIGLRVVDDKAHSLQDLQEPAKFFGALVAMLTGIARNELEDLLARRAARSIIIEQPSSLTGGPPNILDVKAINAGTIRTMVQRGSDEARRVLDGIGTRGIYKSEGEIKDSIRAELTSMIRECELIIADAKFRANIFIPIRDRLKMIFSVNMGGDSDDGLEFPDLSSGLNGTCYQLRSRLICNLEKVGQLRSEHPDEYEALFGMPEELQRKIRRDRTWLASTPIFDPYELRVLTMQEATSTVHDEVQRVAFRNVGIELVGPILGILNLDAAWNYAALNLNPDPDFHFADWRIKAILDILQNRSMTIAPILTALFP